MEAKNERLVHISEIIQDVALVTMKDTVNKNAFTKDFCLDLIQVFDEINKNNSYKAVILTGFENYFASGATKADLLALHENKIQFTESNIYSIALDCCIPVISAMQGHAIGGGFVLGMFADVVILSCESIYTTNFMKYGFTPGMGATYILPRKLGISLSEEMLMTAQTYRGTDLQKRGIPFTVVPRKSVLENAIELARLLSEKTRFSLITLKNHMVREMREQLPDYIQKELQMHQETLSQSEVKNRIETLFGR